MVRGTDCGFVGYDMVWYSGGGGGGDHRPIYNVNHVSPIGGPM